MGMFDSDIITGLSNHHLQTTDQTFSSTGSDAAAPPAATPSATTATAAAAANTSAAGGGTTNTTSMPRGTTTTDGHSSSPATTAGGGGGGGPSGGSGSNAVVASSTGTVTSGSEAGGAGSLAGILLKYLLMADHAQSTVDVLIEMDLAKESNSAIREEFSRTKGCEYIVTAMKTLGDSVDMQWKCCKLLLFLTFKHERNNVAFHKADASQVIVESMRKFPQDRNMQSYGCGALCNLAFHNAFKVVEAGGIEVVIAAMKNYSKDPNVQVYACGCLKALASADDAFKKTIFDSGGAILLVEAQHRFRDKNDKVVHVAHEALQYMYAK